MRRHVISAVWLICGVILIAPTPSTTSAAARRQVHPELVQHFDSLLEAYQPLHSSHVIHRRGLIAPGRTLQGTSHLTIPVNGEDLQLRLHQDNKLFSRRVEAVTVGADGVERPFVLDKSVFYAGTVEGQPTSSVHLHIKNGVISGNIKTDSGQTYIIEPVHKHAQSLNVSIVDHADMIIYDSADMVWPSNHQHFSSSTSKYCEAPHLEVPADHPPVNHSQRLYRRALPANQNTCSMALVADFKFFVANGQDTALVAELLVQYLSFVDSNFRTTDFGNGVSDVGLAVKKIIIYTSSQSDPYFQTETHDVNALLNLFATTDFREFCLAHLFTHQDFDSGVQGLAWVANSVNSGICDGFGADRSRYFNTGLTTGLNHGQNILQLMLMLVLQHEIGHNFGSQHDPDTTECAPSNNRFVMFFSAVDGSASNNKLFSSCSKDRMRPIISLRAPVCFTAEPQGICGNSRVEAFGADGQDDGGGGDDEQCDAGSTGDDCCDSSCKLKPGADCSDANSRCCRNCSFAGEVLASNGVDVLVEAKICFTGFDADPECRASTFCTNASVDCPSTALKADGEECSNGGFCRPNVTDPAEVCGSVCALPELGAKPCSCSVPNECQICCEDDPEWCPPGYVFETRTHDIDSSTRTACFEEGTTGFNDSTEIPTANHPFTSTCQPAHEVLTQPEFANLTNHDGEAYSSSNVIVTPGTVCTNGLCDANGLCEEATDDFTSRILDGFKNLSINAIVEWMQQNIVAAVILGSLLLWVPVGYILNRKDKKLLKKLQKDADYVRKRRRHTFKMREGAQRPRDNRVRPMPHHRQAPPQSTSPAKRVQVASGTTGGWVDEYEC